MSKVNNEEEVKNLEAMPSMFKLKNLLSSKKTATEFEVDQADKEDAEAKSIHDEMCDEEYSDHLPARNPGKEECLGESH